MSFNLRLIFVAMSIVPAIASAKNWEPVNSKARPNCDAETTCRLSQANGNFEIHMSSKLEGEMQVLTELQIRNLKTGATQKFALEEMNNRARGEFFELYKIELPPKGTKGLALHAYNSAREGEVYYYFLYDQTKQKFVMSEGTFPKLKYDAKSKTYLSELQENKYFMDKNLRLNSAP